LPKTFAVPDTSFALSHVEGVTFCGKPVCLAASVVDAKILLPLPSKEKVHGEKKAPVGLKAV